MRADLSSWDGTWSGRLGVLHAWPISVTISRAKVVSFSEKGVPLDVRNSEITPTTVSFGDQINYSTRLVKTGDRTASMTVEGRHGVEAGLLEK